MNATWAEPGAVRDYAQRAVDHIRQGDAMERLAEIAGPRLATLPVGATVGAAMALMTDTERAEVEQDSARHPRRNRRRHPQ